MDDPIRTFAVKNTEDGFYRHADMDLFGLTDEVRGDPCSFFKFDDRKKCTVSRQRTDRLQRRGPSRSGPFLCLNTDRGQFFHPGGSADRSLLAGKRHPRIPRISFQPDYISEGSLSRIVLRSSQALPKMCDTTVAPVPPTFCVIPISAPST